MNVKSSVLVSVAAFLVTGCCTTDCERSRSFQSSLPVSAETFEPSKRPEKHKPVKCSVAGNPTECVIPVEVKNKCRAKEIGLQEFVMLDSAINKIVWKLSDGYVFCPHAGDGVFLKNPNVPAGLFDPQPEPGCSDTFVWNRLSSDGYDYAYFLRFRQDERGNKICGVKDPWMRN